MDASIPRAEHLQWCKTRALQYCDEGNIQEAFASMASDLNKHPGTAKQIVVDGPCVITVIGHDTRLGIEAEPHVKILRAELLEDVEPDEPTVIHEEDDE